MWRSSWGPWLALLPFPTWLMWTEGMEAAETDEWLGELGRDLQGPMESCCFFRRATTF